MRIGVSSTPKRRRLTNFDLMELEKSKAKITAAAEKLGREIRVFETSLSSATSQTSSNEEEPDDFYEFTAQDYYRVLSTKKEDNFLKTRKIREAEESSRRSRITKTIIRIRFPDNYTLEAKFHSSETFQNLIDLLTKVVARPEIPFYIYTTPPKKQIKDMSQAFYSAGFIPGAIVYFSYDLPKGDDSESVNSVPYLQDEILSLIGLDVIPEQAEIMQSLPETVAVGPSLDVAEVKTVEKKSAKPKWFKGR